MALGPARILHSVKIDLYFLLTRRYIPFIDIRQVDQLRSDFQAPHTPDITFKGRCIHIGPQQIRRIIAAHVELEVLGGRGGRSVRRQNLCK